MEEALRSSPSQFQVPLFTSSSSELSEPNHENNTNPSSKSPASMPPPQSSLSRLWRPAAQRNLRNQWSNLASYRHKWFSSSSTARFHATSLVNTYLSQRYINAMELGVLSDMPDIRRKACLKLFKQQELHQSKLVSSYKDMVAVVIQMVKTSRSMRCFLKGTTDTPLVQFSSCYENENDTDDGEGIPVYTFWTISCFEKLAHELVQMFALELNLKRLLVVELLSISCEEVSQINSLCWSDELYCGEFDDLSICKLCSNCELVLPKLKGWKSCTPTKQSNHKADADVLQIYLTTWLAEVNIDISRVDEIFAVIGEEMHATVS